MHYQRWKKWGDPLRDQISRFWEKVDKSGECWIWTGYVPDGRYGRVSFGHGDTRQNIPAHRFAYQLLVGSIPEGLQLDHLCRNTLCVRPDHLEAVTARINTLRSDNPTAVNARLTHCRRGHVFDEANTYLTKDGERHCRKCAAARQKRYADEKRECAPEPVGTPAQLSARARRDSLGRFSPQ